MRKIYTTIIISSLTFFGGELFSQNIAINSTGAAANAASLLEIGKGTLVTPDVLGLLIPRVNLTATNSNLPIGAGIVMSLLVYNNATAGVSPNNVLPGYYYWDGTKWIAMGGSGGLNWGLLGNAGTVDGTNFIGTTDNVPFNIRVFNNKAGRIDNTLQNTFFGYQAGNSTTGFDNTAIGHQALYSNISGTNNTASGYAALYFNTGNQNTASGQEALYANTNGSGNTASGFQALRSNTTGGLNNTASGMQTLYSNTTGSSNSAYGTAALYNNLAGSNATAIGANAMQYANSTATGFTNYNVAVGYEALRGSTTASANTGNWNTALGYQSLWSNTTGNFNTATGQSALYSNNGGGANTASGMNALYFNTTGSNNTSSGVNALYSNTIGNENTATGVQALYVNATGSSNTANGNFALYSNVAGSNATAIGYNAMLYANNTATPFTNYNVAVGFEALRGSAPASANTGIYNAALGYQALFSNISGNSNTASGEEALWANTSGGGNTACGYRALQQNSIGVNNTACGWGAGIIGGNNQCTFIGANTYLTTSRANVTMLGYNVVDAQCTGNSQVCIGNTAVAFIKGQVGFTTYSDARFKTNIKDNVAGLDFILKLKPVTYNVRPRELHKIWGTPDSVVSKIDHSEIEKIRFIGFLAQDVEKAAQESGFDFPGIDVPRNDKEVYALRYVDFIMPMVKGMQELNEKLEEENANLKAQLLTYDVRLKNLEQSLGTKAEK